VQRFAFRIWRWAMQSPGCYALGGKLARLGMWLGIAKPLARLWTERRDLPDPPRQAFRDWWRSNERA